MSAILNAPTRTVLREQQIKQKVNQIGFESFESRLRLLNKRFKLGIAPAPADIEQLEHFSDRRNVAVHDQGAFEFGLSETGELVLRQKTCLLHPTPVNSTQLRRALAAYDSVARAIAHAVAMKVLKDSATKDLLEMIEALSCREQRQEHDREAGKG